MPRSIVAALVVLALSIGPDGVAAQEVRLGQRQPNGSWSITIQGVSYLAIPVDMQQRIRILDDSLSLLVQQVRIRDSMITLHQVSDSVESAFRAHQKFYIAELETQVDRYRELARGYKRLSNQGYNITFEAGLGASGHDTEPAILAGLGIRRVRIWGFLQKDNFGGMVGMNFPIW